MVKGVSRNIIEINNTGSDCFERIVFYISPDFSASGRNVADIAANELEKILNGSRDCKISLRYRVKAKKRRRAICIIAGAVIIIFAAVIGIVLRK